ncbi:unnamed protein product [Mytilus coruscus]|uniref:LRAT domain-containing protein n=1 Tax=Mytilus coruscus TaxID=42192 RepID=A0A6J8DDN5_MYTCO|nr:unnamed protein product [Mytilus coruscus]
MNNTEEKHSNVKCKDCAQEQRVVNFKKLKPGDTFWFPGGVVKVNIFNKRFRYITYKHYALIKSLVLLDIDGYSAMISMIQFIWAPYSKSMIIREITEIKSVYKDEIYKYIYRYPTNSPEEIISRAEQLLEESKLRSKSVLSYNFEHMVWWCVFETTQCLQFGVLEKIVQRADDAGGKLRKLACFWGKVDETPQDNDGNILQNNPCVLQYESPFSRNEEDVKLLEVHIDHRRGKLISTNTIKNAPFPRADIVRRARAKLKEQNYSIFRRRASHFADEIVHRGENFVVSSFSDIQQGDVIIYSYWALWHEAVVTKVNKKSFEIVHYGLQHFFATREIIKEELEIDVKKQVIKKKEFSGYLTYPSKVTVKRALSRIGERRFSVFGNRSDDFAHWCKVVQTPSIYSIQPAAKGQNDNKTIQKGHYHSSNR